MMRAFFTLQTFRFECQGLSVYQRGDSLSTILLALFALAVLVVVGFGVGRYYPLEVSEYHLVRSLRYDVVWHNGSLAATARSIYHECRYGIARGVSSEVLDNLYTLRYGSAEVFQAHR